MVNASNRLSHIRHAFVSSELFWIGYWRNSVNKRDIPVYLFGRRFLQKITMGFLTVLKKMRQKEKEMRVLLL